MFRTLFARRQRPLSSGLVWLAAVRLIEAPRPVSGVAVPDAVPVASGVLTRDELPGMVGSASAGDRGWAPEICAEELVGGRLAPHQFRAGNIEFQHS